MNCTTKTTCKKELLPNLYWAAIMLTTAFAAAFACKHGYISADTKLRVVAMNGLWVAWYGNRMPKVAMPSAMTQKIRRVAGWSMVLSGLVYAALFVFAPIKVATIAGTSAIVIGIAATFSYCIRMDAKAKAC